MSSHREAPGISKDPAADNTDTYAFVSPDAPDTVTIISNYVPLEAPFGGPNFFEFGDDVLYEIHIDNDADGVPEITYQFLFETRVANPNTFLYNTGQILSIGSANWNRKQFYSVTKVVNGQSITQFTLLMAQTRALVASVTRLSNDLEREPTKLLFGDQRQGYTPK